jgi:hypothetical protein
VALLLALKAIFAEGGQEILDKQGLPAGRAMHTETILPKLHEADPRWMEYGRSGKPLSERDLARLLKGFRIKPKGTRIGGFQKRGYRVSDFDDAFGRYCPAPCCDFCGAGERADDPLLTSYDGETSVLLHRSCWPSWAAAAGR